MVSRTNSYSSASSASTASSASSAAASPSTAAPATFGDNRGIKFEIRTGTNRWACTLQDRSIYERTKVARTGSTDSVATDASGN